MDLVALAIDIVADIFFFSSVRRLLFLLTVKMQNEMIMITNHTALSFFKSIAEYGSFLQRRKFMKPLV